MLNDVDMTDFIGLSEQQDKCSLYINVFISNLIYVHIVI